MSGVLGIYIHACDVRALTKDTGMPVTSQMSEINSQLNSGNHLLKQEWAAFTVNCVNPPWLGFIHT